MKRRILSLCLSLVLAVGLLPMGALTASAATINFNGLPVLDITLNKPLELIHASKNNAATDGQVTLYDTTGKQKVSARLAQFKGRGNASWKMAGDKRSYNLKCSEAVELIPGAGKGKNWVLIANNVIYDVIDRTGLANMAAFEMYRQMGGSSALSIQPVELYLQGNYRGTYLLAEKVEIDKDRIGIQKPDMTQDENPDHLRTVDASSKNITAAEQALLDKGIVHFRYAPGSKVKTAGGFILEADSRYQSSAHEDSDGEASWFVTRYGAQIVVKEPEFVTLEQLTAIATYVQEFEDALYNRTGYNSKGKYYTEYVDMPSLAKKVLLDCITAQLDIFKTSCYFYIDGNANGLKGKLITGPAWDYDYMVLNTQDLYCSKEMTHGKWANGARNWLTQLLTKGGFVDLLYDMNRDMLNGIATTMANETLNVYYQQMLRSQLNNQTLWKNNYEEKAPKFIQNFKTRVANWKTTVWGPEHLMGVTVSTKSGTITAAVNGTANSYSWCKVNENDPTDYVDLGVHTPTYTPTEKGTYFVKVQGEPLGSGTRYGGSSNEVAGKTMYSALVHVGCIHSLKGTAAVPATCGTSGTAAYWTCTLCGSLFADAKGEVSIAAPKVTAPTGKHSWDNGVVTLAAACDATGLRTYSCKNCTATKVNILPMDPSAPPRNTIIKTEDDKIITGNQSQGTVIETPEDLGDGYRTELPQEEIDKGGPGGSTSTTVKPPSSKPTDSSSDADGTGGEDDTSAPDGNGTVSDGSGGTVTRPATDTPADGDAAPQQGMGWLEIGILAVAVAACLGVLIPLVIVTIRNKRRMADEEALPEETPAPPADEE